jgi:hypothetical protein
MKAFLEKYHAAAAVALVLAFIIALVSALLFTWGMIRTTQTEIEARQTQFEALKRRAALPATKTANHLQNVDPYFSDGPFALVANELQQRVVGLIEQAGGTLVSVGVDPPVTGEDESSRKAVVQATAELTNDGLQEVLYQLESQAPFVFVDNLIVTRAMTRGSGDAEEPVSPRLSVDLRASGYFRKAASQ